MVAEVLAGLEVNPAGTYVDATFGSGGHSRALLEKLGAAGRIEALDADASCVAADHAVGDGRLKVNHVNYRDMASLLAADSADGVIMDLGLSMTQLRDGQRGFSLQLDGPLDMRFDNTSKRTLASLLRSVSESSLGGILREYGEERHWRKIAKAIIRQRQHGSLVSTADLVAACLRGSGPGWKRLHPATRVFQALRIWVNDELNTLGAGLEAAATILRPGGRLVVICFHSLEDRIVKRFLKPIAGDPGILRPVGKLQRPTPEELAANKSSRSAKLRVGTKP